MAASREIQLVEKLNANNYNNWKFKTEMLLIREDLFDVITEDRPTPVTTDWEKKDRKARAIINLSIDDSQIVHVKGLNTARDTWNALKTIHERANLSSKLFLLRKLYGAKLQENGNLIKHITYILELIDKLSAIGETISDSHLSALLLCSLPPSYNTLITALESRNEDELTPQFIRSKLTDEYNRRVENTDQGENSSKAFKTQKRFPNDNFKKDKQCTYCKMRNHTYRECWHLKNRNNHPNTQKQQTYKNKYYSSSLCYQQSDNQIGNTDRRSVNTRNYRTETKPDQGSDAAFLIDKAGKQSWIIDSGSSSHILNNKNEFTKLNDTEKTAVIIANGKTLNSLGTGETTFTTKTSDGGINKITLKEVLYVPELESNLISVSKATKNGYKLLFDKDKCTLSRNGKIYLEAKMKNNLYEVELLENADRNIVNMAHECQSKDCPELWHKRLGHRNYNSIKEMVKDDLAYGIKLNNCNHGTTCETCIQTKTSDAPYPKTVYRNKTGRVLDLVHTDVCTAIGTPTIGGKTMFVTFIDDYSRFTVIYLLKHKDEVQDKLIDYIAMVRNQFGIYPKAIRSDNGGEYINSGIEDYLRKRGIKHQLTVPYCPSQNGIAERKNRSLLDMTRSLLREADLPQRFWGEAINTANHLQNRLPTRSTNKTPFELWFNRKPSLHYLRTFGCKAYVYVNKQHRGKLDDRAQEGIFVGYDNNSQGYRIYTKQNKIVIGRTVKFMENSKINLKESKETENSYDDKNYIEAELNNTTEEPTASKQPTNEPRRSERTNRGVPPDRYVCYVKNNDTIEPSSWNEILEINNPREKENWLKATQAEINSLRKHNTWELVDPPPNKKVIGCKWTFKKKLDSHGNTQKYKARLVAKGFSQKYGENYDETFAPVVSQTTIRTFLAAAAYKKLNVRHIDIDTAFLYGELEDEVYMKQPEGYIEKNKENKVCKLKKSIYGLKQAARTWNKRIEQSLKKLNFQQSTADSCLYTRKENNITTYIIVYVDDILIGGENESIEKIIKTLKQEYELKDLGEVSHYLGMEIRKTQNGYKLNQRLKIEELARKFNLENAKPISTPMDAGFHKLEDDEALMPNNTKFRQAIGSLLYIGTTTRPDISAAVNILSRRCETPRFKDWNAAKRIISYLNITRNLNLTLNTNQEPQLIGFSDADWAGDTKTRRSTTGNLFMLGNSPIQWYSKRQNCIAYSSAEAEFVAAASAGQEIAWLIKLLADLDLEQNLPVILYEDNQSCIKMVENEKFSKRTKHIDVRYHAIKEMKEDGILDLRYCPTQDMTADALTKPLGKPQFVKHRESMQLLHDAPEMVKEG